jgi:signal transduction histidine kinase
LPSVPGFNPASLLARIHRQTGCEYALVALAVGAQLHVEQSSPAGGLLGQRLRAPEGLLGRPTVLDARNVRLPLDWTLVCGGRPDYLAAAPVGEIGHHLLVVGFAGGEATVPDAPYLAANAEQLDHLLAAGHLLQADRRQLRQIRALVDNLPSPVIFVDSRASQTLLNNPARRLLGIDEGAGQDRVALALRRFVAGAGIAGLSSEPSSVVHFVLEHEAEAFEVTARLVDEERLSGRLWIFREITAERAAARFRDELIANVSHELRTPLTSIVGALGLLEAGEARLLAPPFAKLVEIASKNAVRLSRLVDDLLDSDRLESDRFEFEPRTVDLAALVGEAVELNRPYAGRFPVTLDYTPGRSCLVRLDPDRLLQVLGNVIGNAAKFSPVGGTVGVGVGVGAEDGRARITVIDHGCGMSPAFQQRLFTRFAREEATSASRSGSGLGLVIARGIVEQMGGTIAISSREGEGTTVTIVFPLADQAPA